MSDRRNEVTAVGTGGALPTTEGELPPGTLIGEFRIECTLGRGGMGNVYGAVHTMIGKRGAVKVLRHDLCTDRTEVERFIQEARAVNQIGHANIVDVFAFGWLPDGRSYLVMEWLNGESLRERMMRGPLSRSQIYDLMTDIVSALEAAHRAEIVHRDLKPDNVFLVETQGDRRRAKLLDFGVAKLTAEGKAGWTQMGALIGTPQYIAPEQARGEATFQSDIYALGILLFELLAGRPPFVAPNMVEIVSMHMMEPPPRLSAFAEVTKELDDLVDAMLAKDGAARPTLAEIRAGLEELVKSGHRTLKVPRSSPGRRWPWALGAVVVLGAGLATFAIVRATREDSDATPPRPEPVAVTKPPSASALPPKPDPPKRAPTPAPGTLFVAVKLPKGVEIEVAGTRWGPYQDLELPAGQHKFVILRNGKKIDARTVDITEGKQTKIEVRLAVPTNLARDPVVDDSLRPPR